MMSESVSALELATVKFLSRCCWCHPANQKLLANVLCDVISQQKTQGSPTPSNVVLGSKTHPVVERSGTVKFSTATLIWNQSCQNCPIELF